MPTLLLLSSNETQFNVLNKSMPDSVKIIRIKMISEVFQHIQDEKSLPFLVLIDGTEQPDLSVYCRDISQVSEAIKLPVVAIIDSPSQREKVLNNGADGYLLFPLLHVEVMACINQYLSSYELSRIYRDMQDYIAQMAYMVLISKIIVEASDLNTILSKVLQQIVNIYIADSGEIWLFAEDDQLLKLESSLFVSPFSARGMQQCRPGQGLIGWTWDHKEPLVVEDIATDPKYQVEIDHINSKMDHDHLLAVNLHTQDKKLGVLVLYRQVGSFQPQEVSLLEEIASLVAGGIYNALTLQSLSYHAEQQRVLYEMSQQISAGLDLNTTLKRAVQWVGRLTDAEIGLIWLVDESEGLLVAVTCFGMEFSEPIMGISVDEFNYNRVSIVVNDPYNDHFTTQIAAILNIKPQNALILPIKQRGTLLGMVTLFNKVSGPFVEAEQKLLTTAIEMIAIAIGNARLYNQTRSLIDEKERLHKKALQNERLRTIGRLTASVAHEINNPMQAIRGALSLALEEINSPTDLEEYIRLSQQEANRVIKLVNRMRQLYRPTTDQAEEIQVLNLFREVLEISRDEMLRQNVKLILNLPESSPVCFAIANHLHLAFLTILLNLTDAIGEAGGGSLLVRVSDLQSLIRIEFILQPPINSSFDLGEKPEASQSIESQVEMISGYSSVVDAIAANGGKINLLRTDSQTIIKVELFKNIPE